MPWSLHKMVRVSSWWEIPEIIDEPRLIADSAQFYDDKEDPYSTARDRKNMRIMDNSRVIIKGGSTSNNGSGCTIKIDPDESNILEDRKKGLYVPPVTWEKLT